MIDVCFITREIASATFIKHFKNSLKTLVLCHCGLREGELAFYGNIDSHVSTATKFPQVCKSLALLKGSVCCYWVLHISLIVYPKVIVMIFMHTVIMRMESVHSCSTPITVQSILSIVSYYIMGGKSNKDRQWQTL